MEAVVTGVRGVSPFEGPGVSLTWSGGAGVLLGGRRGVQLLCVTPEGVLTDAGQRWQVESLVARPSVSTADAAADHQRRTMLVTAATPESEHTLPPAYNARQGRSVAVRGSELWLYWAMHVASRWEEATCAQYGLVRH